MCDRAIDVVAVAITVAAVAVDACLRQQDATSIHNTMVGKKP